PLSPPLLRTAGGTGALLRRPQVSPARGNACKDALARVLVKGRDQGAFQGAARHGCMETAKIVSASPRPSKGPLAPDEHQSSPVIVPATGGEHQFAVLETIIEAKPQPGDPRQDHATGEQFEGPHPPPVGQRLRRAGGA